MYFFRKMAIKDPWEVMVDKENRQNKLRILGEIPLNPQDLSFINGEKFLRKIISPSAYFFLEGKNKNIFLGRKGLENFFFLRGYVNNFFSLHRYFSSQKKSFPPIYNLYFPRKYREEAFFPKYQNTGKGGVEISIPFQKVLQGVWYYSQNLGKNSPEEFFPSAYSSSGDIFFPRPKKLFSFSSFLSPEVFFHSQGKRMVYLRIKEFLGIKKENLPKKFLISLSTLPGKNRFP